MKNENVIAIDGPAGSGKSSVAKEVAKVSDYNYFDSGSYYRAVTLFLLERFRSVDSNVSFDNWISRIDLNLYLKEITLHSVLDKQNGNKTFLNNIDVSNAIRLPEVTEEIKYIARIQIIRDFVNGFLYMLSEKNKLIIDGRDIGTAVFPNAKVKIFLTANPNVRAERRKLEQEEMGIETDLDELIRDINKRDESDIKRKIAPLKQAEDALLIDTSALSKNVVISMILSKL